MKVLITPLDWGLGHASRCVPIVRALLAKNCQVILGGSGLSGLFLKQEFPDLPFLELPDYKLRYSKHLPLPLQLLRQFPRVKRAVQTEIKCIQKWEQQGVFDLLISDNRFGCQSKNKKSAYITHQLQVQTGSSLPLANQGVSALHKKFYQNHNFIWVPDFPNHPGISGDLGHLQKPPANLRYLGPLSRFEKQNLVKKFKLCFLLSGLEPHRSLFESKLMEQIPAHLKKEEVVLIRGRPDHPPLPPEWDSKATIYPFLSGKELEQILSASEIVICRSGYSSIMDLMSMELSAAFCPTPGQAEQEYLAKTLKNSGFYYFEHQNHFDLQRVLHEQKLFSPPTFETQKNQLDLTLEEFLNA